MDLHDQLLQKAELATIEEGGMWVPVENLNGHDWHSLMMSDGRVWDSVLFVRGINGGWRTDHGKPGFYRDIYNKFKTTNARLERERQ